MSESRQSQEVVIDIWADPASDVEDEAPPSAQTLLPQKPEPEHTPSAPQPALPGVAQQEIAELKRKLKEAGDEAERAMKIVAEERALREHAEHRARKAVEQLATSQKADKNRDVELAYLQQQLSASLEEKEQLALRVEAALQGEHRAKVLAEQERARAEAFSEEAHTLHNRCEEYAYELHRRNEQERAAHERRAAEDSLPKRPLPLPSSVNKPAAPSSQSPWGGQPTSPTAAPPPQRKARGPVLPPFLEPPAPSDPPPPPPPANPPKRPLIGPAFGDGDTPAESDCA
jgi:hypothetical protein